MRVVVPPLTYIKIHVSKIDCAMYLKDENHFDSVVNMTNLKMNKNLHFDMNKILYELREI